MLLSILFISYVHKVLINIVQKYIANYESSLKLWEHHNANVMIKFTTQ